ncbi:hypothetical protein K435DRAFT_296966 [Dendrothele bispora CBS 962.96]|uniref:Uncharacterized protein n=1 Tax=Dendrothele bispora (strain CBS 962.96) TaxID=1314807 RepID=A0A4S8LJ74_DENBC|nr:hypothetical protein K435DRAFT_296966 [Dendrothele bispora CBS 962.96]
MVTRCQRFQLLQSDLKATGVQYTLSSTSPRQTVNENNKTQASRWIRKRISPDKNYYYSCTGSFAIKSLYYVASLAYSTTFSVTTAGSIHVSKSSYSQSSEPMSFISSATAYLSLFLLHSSIRSSIPHLLR